MDKFYLEEGEQRKNLRNTILRELVGNVLAHREFTSSYMAKFVIEKDRMYIENANRATKEGYITPDNTEPDPKNPIIASFFRNIGYADQLGSGVRNLFKYSKFYSGKDPEFKEGDIFRITVPLDDEFSYDFSNVNADKVPKSAEEVPKSAEDVLQKISEQQRQIYEHVLVNKMTTTSEVKELLGVKDRRAREILSAMCSDGILIKVGSTSNLKYVFKEHK